MEQGCSLWCLSCECVCNRKMQDVNNEEMELCAAPTQWYNFYSDPKDYRSVWMFGMQKPNSG